VIEAAFEDADIDGDAYPFLWKTRIAASITSWLRWRARRG
jgi:hypothetical protein